MSSFFRSIFVQRDGARGPWGPDKGDSQFPHSAPQGVEVDAEGLAGAA